MRELRWACSALLIVVGAALLLLDAGGCAKQRAVGGLSKLKPCRVEGTNEELLCGKLTVFENRQMRTGRTIDLNIVVLPALDQKTKAEPLFDLAGGPGASSAKERAFTQAREKSTAAGMMWCALISAAPANQIALRFRGRRHRNIT